MRLLFLLCIAGIVYGSLFPFAVVWQWPDAASVRDFFASWNDVPSRGDVLGNVLLFIPYGLFGRCVWTVRRTLWTGVVLAVALQVAQFWIDGRAPQIQDAIWNTVGLAAGLGFAGLAVVRDGLRSRALTGWQTPPVVLVAFWMASVAVPFVPTIDLAQVIDSVKPLFRRPWPDLPQAFLIMASWLAAGCLVQEALPGRRAQRLALAGLLGLFAVLKLAIVGNHFQPPDVAGTAAAFLLWFWRGERTAGRRGIAGGLLVVALVWRGLDPFVFRARPGHFYWLPFSGALEGSIMINLRAMLAKIFIYGGAIWLLGRGGRGLAVATAVVAAATLAVEIGQAWTGRGVPEITDPLIALALGLMLSRWRSGRG